MAAPMRLSAFAIRCALIFSLLPALFSCRFFSGVESGGPILVFTFDDGHSSIYEYALPILAEYGFRATNFINSGRIRNPNRLTWEQVRELEFQHGWETGGHTVNHEDLHTLTFQEAESAIGDDYQALKSQGLNPVSFALPGGSCPDAYYEIIRRHYRNIRNSYDYAMARPVDRLSLGYFPFQSGWTAAEIKDRILRGIARREAMIIIGFHYVESPDGDLYGNCPALELREIMRFASDRCLRVMTLAEAMREL